MSSQRYLFGPYSVADSGRALLRDGKAVPATPKVLATLLVLLRAGGQTVSKEELLKAVWPDSFVEEGNLTQNISVLRKLLAEDYPDTSPIETVPRLGYRLRVEVRIEDDPQEAFATGGPVRVSSAVASLPISTPSGASTDSAPASVSTHAEDPEDHGAVAVADVSISAPSHTSLLSRVLRWRNLQTSSKRLFAAAALLIVVGSIVSFTVALHKRNVSAATMRPPLHPRIAVLAFTNLSHSAENAWVADALRETLSADLGADPDLRVLPGETVARAERELQLGQTGSLGHDTLERICHDLDCDQVVSGSYLVAGGKVRLDTHLFDADSGALLGSYTATRPLDDLLPLISETGASMRSTFGLQPASAASREAVRASVSKDPEAYKLYIKGLEHLRGFDGRAAVDLFERSIALDPQFSLAHHELSGAYVILGQEGKAVSEAHLAESLAGQLPREDQLNIKAGARNAERNFEAAAEIYKTLFTSYPDELDYARMMAAELSYAGHPQQALDTLRPVMAQSPPAARDPRLYSVVADCYSMMGDWNSSLAWAKDGADESQRRGAKVIYGRLLTTETQALLHLQQLPEALARTQEALAIARQFQDLSGELRALNRLGQIQTAMGQWPQAQGVLEQALALEERLGESERQIHTLSALGLGFQKHGNGPQAGLMFQRQLTMAQDYGQPIFVAEAELNLARLEMQQGKVRSGTEKLHSLVQRGAQLNDRQLVADATEALSAKPAPLN